MEMVFKVLAMVAFIYGLRLAELLAKRADAHLDDEQREALAVVRKTSLATLLAAAAVVLGFGFAMPLLWILPTIYLVGLFSFLLQRTSRLGLPLGYVGLRALWVAAVMGAAGVYMAAYSLVEKVYG